MTQNLQKIITFILLSLLFAFIYDFTEVDMDRIQRLHQIADSVYQSKLKRLETIKPADLESKISLNNASHSELTSLKGIGPKMADKIIEYRKKSSFKKVEDLTKIKGIGPKKYDKIKSRLVL